jgi:GDPmannose 4,6-dehydratase
MSGKRALITGISGQDGSYLAELLIEKGYEVHGTVLPAELEDPQNSLFRLEGVRSRLRLHAAVLKSYAAIRGVFAETLPHECYHLAAQSFVSYSLDDEFSTLETNIGGTHFVLAALKELAPECRFFFAGSSAMFGSAEEVPWNERTHFRPRSIYGISKVAGFELTRNYRENYGLHASGGILFNHESPRRGFEFVTRKITSGVARILAGRQDKLLLGNLEARRDWGHAREYVEAMWLMLQQPEPDDYVVATGETHTVGEFVELACSYAGLDPGKHVEVDPRLYRPAEGDIMQGDAAKARTRLGWRHRIGFAELVLEMLVHDCAVLGVAGRLPAAAWRRG